WQDGISKRNGVTLNDARIDWRVGIDLGGSIIDEDEIHGDGVNIAARLEALAPPGGICVSHAGLSPNRGTIHSPVLDLGDKVLKNIAQSVRVYQVGPPRVQAQADETQATGMLLHLAALQLPDRPSIAVLPFQSMSGDPEQEYFTDGMVEEIITALS